LSLSLAALIQLVTVRRPRARTALRNINASLGVGRRSRIEASRANHWHAVGSGCEDIIEGVGSGRGLWLVW
jgi:hypothetical protein